MPGPPEDMQKTLVGAPPTAAGGDHDPGDPLVGQTLQDRYRILKKLGEGGMGVVYLAEHVMLEKKVAVKLLSEDMSRKQDLVQRFMQEAKAASRVGQENIIDVTDVGQTPEGSVYFVMEFLEGEDLSSLLRREGALPWTRLQAILAQICRALQAAHSKGIIHRDLKPENVFLIEREGRKDFVKVLDFGIAKMSAEGEEGARLTRTGMIFGTPEYMSPEQAKGEKVDHRVDIYALGVIAYEMVCGGVPFKADSFMGVLTKHMMETPEVPSRRRPDLAIPKPIEDFILRALAKDRDQRFRTMEEFGAALTACRWEGGGGAIGAQIVQPDTKPSTAESTHGEARPKTARSAVPPIAAVAVAALAVGVGAWMLLERGGEVPVALAPESAVLEAPPTQPATTAIPPGQPPPAQPQPEPPPAAPPAPAAAAGKPSRPARRPAPAPADVPVQFQTTPPGALVVWNDEIRGQTPFTLSMPVSDAATTVVLRKNGYRDRKVEVVPDQARAFVLPLDPLPKAPLRLRRRTHVKRPTRAVIKKEQPTTQPVAPAKKSKPATGLKDPFGQ